MSFSDYKINTDLVCRLISKQFPQWADLPVRPVEKGGYDNFTFHLGDQMSVRLPRDEGHAPQVEKEAEWLPKLKPHLSMPITVPLAKGMPDEGYPFHWSVNRWIDGETLRNDNISDINEFAVDLSVFLKELQSIDATNGPAGGEHNYFRGCPLTVWKFNEWTLGAIETLRGAVDAEKCLKIWHQATASEWTKEPVWIHGDINPGNLLVKNGKLSLTENFSSMQLYAVDSNDRSAHRAFLSIMRHD